MPSFLTSHNTFFDPESGGGAPYVVSCFVPGLLLASQYLLIHRLSRAVRIPAGFGGYLEHTSQARGTVNATASMVVAVQKSVGLGSFSPVGTITVAAGGMAGAFATLGGAIDFARGDSLALVAPASADATFANFAATLVGYEV